VESESLGFWVLIASRGRHLFGSGGSCRSSGSAPILLGQWVSGDSSFVTLVHSADLWQRHVDPHSGLSPARLGNPSPRRDAFAIGDSLFDRRQPLQQRANETVTVRLRPSLLAEVLRDGSGSALIWRESPQGV
jgi:hypothetical protein